jgi:uncharacterized protein (TIGR02391 family)
VDYERALKVIDEYLTLIEAYEHRCRAESKAVSGSRSEQEHREARESLETEIRTRLPIVVSIGEQFFPTFQKSCTFGTSTRAYRFYNVKNAVLHLRGQLRDSAEREEIIGVAGPRIAAADLHPTVWSAAARLWDGGHYRQAVESAATAVNDQLRAKLDRYDTSGADLVSQAFSTKDPQPGKPRLRFAEVNKADVDSWNSAHEGAMHFGRGCMMSIRNIVAHNPDEIDPQVALEQLAALSVLARWIDRAEVVREAGLGAD